MSYHVCSRCPLRETQTLWRDSALTAHTCAQHSRTPGNFGGERQEPQAFRFLATSSTLPPPAAPALPEERVGAIGEPLSPPSTDSEEEGLCGVGHKAPLYQESGNPQAWEPARAGS